MFPQSPSMQTADKSERVTMLTTATEELENSYLAVLQGIEETSVALQGMRREISLVLSDKKLNDCLERLDAYAANLHRLDQRLGKIVESDANVMERVGNLPKYSALMQLGTSGYDQLYRDYSTLRRLRDRRFFMMLSVVGTALIVGSSIMLLLL